MAWHAYEIVFRLRGPLHVGWERTGNIQYTRPYVTGRALWGALANRLTRDGARDSGQAAVNSVAYRVRGASVQRALAFSYFYPAVSRSGPSARVTDFELIWPWDAAAVASVTSSYTSTALDYTGNAFSAQQNSLHEMEMIAPHRLTDGKPVHLVGYIFENDPVSALPWRAALPRLQFGADRGYGWGWVELVNAAGDKRAAAGEPLFGGRLSFEDGAGARPAVAPTGDDPRLLAHTRPGARIAGGTVEPVVGREWRSDDAEWPAAGQYVRYNGVAFAPGAVAEPGARFAVGHDGIWEAEA